MKRSWMALLIAVIVEAVAILSYKGNITPWIMDVIILATVLYLLVLAFRGWQKQSRISLPPIMDGKVVQKRHWRLF